MAEKKYFWLKLADDFFTSKRIKKLRSLAGGDTFTIIYLKMQLKALKTDGFLYYDGIMSDFAEELALDIDESVENVKITIQYLLSVGLLECSENGAEYCLTYMKNIIGSEGSSAQRVRAFRARKEQQKALHCNTTETLVKQKCYGEIEIEKEIEIDNTISKDMVSTTPRVAQSIQSVIDAWNDLNLSKVVKISSGSNRAIQLRKRIKDYGLENVLKAIEKIKESDFLQGKNKRGWTITFDWFILPNNFPKVLDGNYDNKKEGGNEHVEYNPETFSIFK